MNALWPGCPAIAEPIAPPRYNKLGLALMQLSEDLRVLANDSVCQRRSEIAIQNDPIATDEIAMVVLCAGVAFVDLLLSAEDLAGVGKTNIRHAFYDLLYDNTLASLQQYREQLEEVQSRSNQT